jgi:hypothetical protein
MSCCSWCTADDGGGKTRPSERRASSAFSWRAYCCPSSRLWSPWPSWSCNACAALRCSRRCDAMTIARGAQQRLVLGERTGYGAAHGRARQRAICSSAERAASRDHVPKAGVPPCQLPDAVARRPWPGQGSSLPCTGWNATLRNSRATNRNDPGYRANPGWTAGSDDSGHLRADPGHASLDRRGLLGVWPIGQFTALMSWLIGCAIIVPVRLR